MIRKLGLVLLLLVVLGLGAVGWTAAQGTSAPAATPAGCATPMASPGASPVSSPVAVELSTPVRVPGMNGAMGPSPTALYPCGTPLASPTP